VKITLNLFHNDSAAFFSLFTYLLGRSIQKEVQFECLFSLQPFPWVVSHSHRHYIKERNTSLYILKIFFSIT